jgi:hypothetical protein
MEVPGTNRRRNTRSGATDAAAEDPMKYDFEAKQRQYRVSMWSAIDAMCSKPIKLRRVVYLDTSQGLETRHLLALGYAPDNLLAVNKNPAHVAALTLGLKRDGLPTIPVAGREWSRFGFGHRDIAAFDGTSNISGNVGGLMLLTLLETTPTVLAFTLLGGRERGEYIEHIRLGGLDPDLTSRRTSTNKQSNKNHLIRIQWVLHCASTYILDDRARKIRAIHEELVDAQNNGDVERAIAACDAWDRGHNGGDLVLPDGVEVDSSYEKSALCVAHVRDVKWNVYQSVSRQPMIWCASKIEIHKFGAPHPRPENFRRVKDLLSIYPACLDGATPHKFERPSWTDEQRRFMHWTV